MAANKVDSSKVPSDVLGDLQALLNTSKKEYIAIGENFYEVTPTSATVLMDGMSQFMELLDTSRERKYDRFKNLDDSIKLLDVYVSVQDLVSDPIAGPKLQEVLEILVEGVDPDDLKKISVGQMLDGLDKAIRVNIDTLPDSFKRQFQAVTNDETPDLKDDEGDDPKNP